MKLRNGKEINKHYQKIENLKLLQNININMNLNPFTPTNKTQFKSFEEYFDPIQSEIENSTSNLNKRVIRRKQNTQKSAITNFNMFDSFAGSDVSYSIPSSQKWIGSTIANTSVNATSKNIELKTEKSKNKRIPKNYKPNKWIALDEISEFRNLNFSI